MSYQAMVERCPACDAAGKCVEDHVWQCTNVGCRVTTFVAEGP